MSTRTPTTVRAALALGMSMRLTRFVATDDFPGRWLIKEPLDRLIAIDYAQRQDAHWVGHRVAVERGLVAPEAEAGETPMPWWYKIRDGLDCPFCVGQWIAFAVVASERATRHTRWAGAWTLLASALTLNETAAHIGARLGDVASEDD